MPKDPYQLSSYQYNLPEDLIAQQPLGFRDSSRLMVIDRNSGNISEMVFRELHDFLAAGDSLVFNNTKVIPARLIGERSGGGQTEIFLVKHLQDTTWEVMARPGKKLRIGSVVKFGDDFSCEIIDDLPEGLKKVRFNASNFNESLERYGKIPLPHYIQRSVDQQSDKSNYQTLYAENPGALAAPTAGLHFTKELLDKLTEKNVQQTKITLHVGLGTFRPVKTEDIRQHPMHNEYYEISPQAADQLNARKAGKRQICIGTTCCRALESIADANGIIIPGSYNTNIFIHSDYKFKYVQAMITNFHLPGSTLLMLVCAFAGYELTMEAYAKAVKEKYRFFSYGDAMLIL